MATETSEKVFNWVEKELQKNPDATTAELYEAAQKKFSDETGNLTARQFNARYPLQVKRRMAQDGAPSSKPSKGSKKKSSPKAAKSPRKKSSGTKSPSPSTSSLDNLQGRDKIRGLFQDFAEKLVAADDRSSLVSVMGSIDSYVDKAVRAAS